MIISKYIAPTSGLESKLQLKEFRKQHHAALLRLEQLDLLMHPFWSETDKAREAELFAEADIEYEKRKAQLKEKLVALSSKKLTLYFEEIEISKQALSTWLAPSVFVVENG